MGRLRPFVEQWSGGRISSKRPCPCRILAVFGQVKKAISSQIAKQMAISAQVAIGLRLVMTWRTYMYIIITTYQLK